MSVTLGFACSRFLRFIGIDKYIRVADTCLIHEAAMATVLVGVSKKHNEYYIKYEYEGVHYYKYEYGRQCEKISHAFINKLSTINVCKQPNTYLGTAINFVFRSEIWGLGNQLRHSRDPRSEDHSNNMLSWVENVV